MFHPTVIIVLAIVSCLIRLQTSMRVIRQLHCVFWSVDGVSSCFFFWFAVLWNVFYLRLTCWFWWICSSSQGNTIPMALIFMSPSYAYTVYLDVCISFAVQRFQIPEIWNTLHFPHVLNLSHVNAVFILWITIVIEPCRFEMTVKVCH